MTQRFTVAVEEAGSRIDRFLVMHCSGVSRSVLQKWIGSGAVTVNGEAVSKHYFLSAGDVVALDEPAQEQVLWEPREIPILYEDDDLLVIDKPAGALVHPVDRLDRRGEWTIANFVLQHLPDIHGVGEDSKRPGVVHRLDREVSGVMVIAKNVFAWESLKKQFAARTVQKEYRAVVFGVPAQPVGDIRLKIAHSKTRSGKMAARPEHEDGRDAWTHYELLNTVKRYSLLAVHIHTGRTHQIRAHLSAIDHPVVGDALYASDHYKTQQKFSRMMLHSYRLTIEHPMTHQQMMFESPIPHEITEIMK